MLRLFAQSGALAVSLLSITCSVALAEDIGPGTYRGYLATDRWGRAVFHNGPCHLFVSDAVAAELKDRMHQPLELDVAEIDQPENPGGARIQKVSKVTPLPPPKLVLSASTKTETAEQGKGVKLDLAVCNTSKEQIELSPDQLKLVLVTDSPSDHPVAGFKDPDNRGYWYYSEAYHDMSRIPARTLELGCHEIPVPWTPQNLEKVAKGVTIGPHRPTDKPPGTYRSVVLEPGATFTFSTVIGAELPAGQYEAFIHSGAGNLSGEPGALSDRVKFDVAEPALGSSPDRFLRIMARRPGPRR